MYEGSIDLQFKNTTNTPVRIETSVGGGKITVRFKGVKTYNVESVNNGRSRRGGQRRQRAQQKQEG